MAGQSKADKQRPHQNTTAANIRCSKERSYLGCKSIRGVHTAHLWRTCACNQVFCHVQEKTSPGWPVGFPISLTPILFHHITNQLSNLTVLSQSSGTNTKFHFPDLRSQQPIGAKFRPFFFYQNPDHFRTNYETFPDF